MLDSTSARQNAVHFIHRKPAVARLPQPPQSQTREVPPGDFEEFMDRLTTEPRIAGHCDNGE